MTNEEYRRYAGKHMPRSHVGHNCLGAFLVGGAICCLGQGLLDLYAAFGLEEQAAATACSVTLVFLGALLTGLGVYDDLARLGGAGTLVPITGPDVRDRGAGDRLRRQQQRGIWADPLPAGEIIRNSEFGIRNGGKRGARMSRKNKRRPPVKTGHDDRAKERQGSAPTAPRPAAPKGSDAAAPDGLSGNSVPLRRGRRPRRPWTEERKMKNEKLWYPLRG